MITIHHAPRTRSTRILWLLEELGADYEIHYIDVARRIGGGAMDPANPHPLKKAPAITHHGVTIVESVIIASYLADLHPDVGLSPPHGTPERAQFDAWMGLYNGVLEPVVTARFGGEPTALENAAYEHLDTAWRGALAKGPYLMADFSAVDILFSSLLGFARHAMPDDPLYDDYLARTMARPAMARALAKDARPV